MLMEFVTEYGMSGLLLVVNLKTYFNINYLLVTMYYYYYDTGAISVIYITLYYSPTNIPYQLKLLWRNPPSFFTTTQNPRGKISFGTNYETTHNPSIRNILTKQPHHLLENCVKTKNTSRKKLHQLLHNISTGNRTKVLSFHYHSGNWSLDTSGWSQGCQFLWSSKLLNQIPSH